MQKTGIEYLDMTWNPIAMRCTPVSRGCDHCWHLRMAKRLACAFSEKVLDFDACRDKNRKKLEAYSGGIEYLDTAELSAPLRRKKPARIGVEFMGDLFHESTPFEWVASIYGVMAASPQHQFLTLTKRPERRFEFFDRKWPLPNVLEGTSVEDQDTADERIPWLLKTPAAKRWVSYESALGPVDFRKIDYNFPTQYSENGIGIEWLDPGPNYIGLDLIVAGSETGPGARPAELDWFRSARDQCVATGVPFFLKQVAPGVRELDGRMHEELP